MSLNADDAAGGNLDIRAPRGQDIPSPSEVAKMTAMNEAGLRPHELQDQPGKRLSAIRQDELH